MDSTTVDCAAPRCGESVEQDYAEYSNILEAQICSACWQSDTEHASAITKFSPDGSVERIILGDLVAMDSEYGEPVDASTWKREWRASSAWPSRRGCS